MVMIMIDGMKFMTVNKHWYHIEEMSDETVLCSYTAPSLASLIILVRGTL